MKPGRGTTRSVSLSVSKPSKRPQAGGGACFHPAKAPPCCGSPNTSCYTRSEKRVGTGGGSHAFSVAGTFRFYCAGVAELVDARDLKSLGLQGPCRFDSGPPHQIQLRPGATRDLSRTNLRSFAPMSAVRPLVGSWAKIRPRQRKNKKK